MIVCPFVCLFFLFGQFQCLDFSVLICKDMYICDFGDFFAFLTRPFAAFEQTKGGGLYSIDFFGTGHCEHTICLE